MNIKQAAASIAALTILAGGPTLALAANASPIDPIAISNVNVQPDGEADGVGPGFVSLQFQNTNNVSATEVVFELDVNGAKVSRFNDIGSFAPGGTIKHAFLNTSADGNAQLNVVKVKFADGSVWTPTFTPAEDNS
jgi:hypothetical protein